MMRNNAVAVLAGILAVGLAAGCQSPGPPKKESLEKPAAQTQAEAREEVKEPEKEQVASSPAPAVEETAVEPEPAAAAAVEEKAAEEAPPPVEEAKSAPEPEPEPEPVAEEPVKEPAKEAVEAGEEKSAPQKTTTIRGEKAELSASKLKMRVDYLGSLVYKSASAKKVEASGNEEAMKTITRSRELYEEARAALDAGDLEKADASMKESMRLVGVASRMAASPEQEAAREKEKYEQMRKSILSFTDAIDRVVKENGEEKKTVEGVDPAAIHKLLDEAESLAASGKHKEANVKLTDAYAKASAALTKLRDKETILITLEFDTPEDEYKYVLQRNESYETLVKVLISEKEPGEEQLRKIDEFVKENRDMLPRAKELADAGNFEEAIKVVDDATKSLSKALRSLGLMVFD